MNMLSGKGLKGLTRAFVGLKSKNAAAILIISIMLISSFSITNAGAYTKEASNILVEDRINALKQDFLPEYGITSNQKELYGKGIDDYGMIYDPIAETDENGNAHYKFRLLENLVAMAALAKDAKVRKSDDSLRWAQSAIFPEIMSKTYTGATFVEYEDAEDTPQYLINQLYFLEFTAQAFDSLENPDMFSKLELTFNTLKDFEAEVNKTDLHNEAPYGAYWTAIEYGAKYHQAGSQLYDYPLTKLSLLVAAASAHIAAIYGDKLSPDDPSYVVVGQALERAKKALSYSDLYCWIQDLGLYNEDQGLRYKRYYVETQIYGLLAAAYLYRATGDQVYLNKADLILESIMKYFWDPGQGGIFHSYSTVNEPMSYEKIKYGFDNALMAYALVQLAESTGVNAKSLKLFWEFERPYNSYMEIVEDIMTFMNTYMWKEYVNVEGLTENYVKGYVEWINSSTGNVTSIDYGLYSNTTRLITTNMLALYALASIYRAEIPFVEFYADYISGVVVTFVVIIVSYLLYRRRKLMGTKVSKQVKDLLSGEL